MTAIRTKPARIAAKALSLLGFAAVGAFIFYLTVQPPTESVALSNHVGDLVKSLASRLGTDGVGGAVAQVIQAVPVRRLGHAGEFFAFGLAASVLVIVWFARHLNVRTTALVAFGICMTGSLFDQVHKIFVPVRHFDWKDLPFDAFGYAAAIVLTFACYAVVRAVRRRSRTPRRKASNPSRSRATNLR